MNGMNINRNSGGITPGLFLFLIFFMHAAHASLPKDSARSKYELNDPRNPDCPCHKYQKMAEEEFRKFQMEGIASEEQKRQAPHSTDHHHLFQKNSDHHSSERNTKPSSEDHLHKTKHQSFLFRRHHKKNKRTWLRRKAYEFRHSELWQRVTDPTACFRWN